MIENKDKIVDTNLSDYCQFKSKWPSCPDHNFTDSNPDEKEMFGLMFDCKKTEMFVLPISPFF